MSPVLVDLQAEVASTEGVEDSAIAFINGVAQKIADAVALALANGATEAELVPFVALKDEMIAKRTALSDAIAAQGGG